MLIPLKSRLAHIMIAALLGLVPHLPSVYATDFGGNRTGEILTAVDGIFRFLGTASGTFSVQGTNGATLDFSNSPLQMNIDLGSGTATGNPVLTITLLDFNIAGNTYTIIGTVFNDNLSGGAGDDMIEGGAGDDMIEGGAGDDIRTDTNTVNCAGDTVTGIETDNCSTTPVTAPAATQTGDLCITDGTRVALDGGMLLVFSDFRDTTNGMTITHIPLASLRAPTDDEKAGAAPVWVGYQDSEYAPGWGAAVYWQNNHYGVVVYRDNGKTVYEDTGAICGWF